MISHRGVVFGCALALVAAWVVPARAGCRPAVSYYPAPVACGRPCCCRCGPLWRLFHRCCCRPVVVAPVVPAPCPAPVPVPAAPLVVPPPAAPAPSVAPAPFNPAPPPPAPVPGTDSSYRPAPPSGTGGLPPLTPPLRPAPVRLDRIVSFPHAPPSPQEP